MLHIIGFALIVLGIVICWKVIRPIIDTLYAKLTGEKPDKEGK